MRARCPAAALADVMHRHFSRSAGPGRPRRAALQGAPRVTTDPRSTRRWHRTADSVTPSQPSVPGCSPDAGALRPAHHAGRCSAGTHRGDDAIVDRAVTRQRSASPSTSRPGRLASDRVTILECARGCRATKRITPTGVSDYACGRWFATTEAEFSGIGGLADLLGQVELKTRWFLIRGRLIEGRHPGRVRRLLYPDPKTGDEPYFEPCPRRWCGLDFDVRPARRRRPGRPRGGGRGRDRAAARAVPAGELLGAADQRRRHQARWPRALVLRGSIGRPAAPS